MTIRNHPNVGARNPISCGLEGLLLVLCRAIESSVLTSVPELAWRPGLTALCVGFRVFVPGGCFHHVAISVYPRLVLRQFAPACGKDPVGSLLAADGLAYGGRRVCIRGPLGLCMSARVLI